MPSFWSNGARALRALMTVALLGAAFSMVTVDYADARRGGGFGSRGFRTFNKPAPTQTAPNQAAPINRSMTPRQQTQSGQPAGAQRQGAQQQARGGMFGGLAGGLLGGLMLGGLIGMLMGHGLGGMAGFLGLLLQVGLLVLAFVFIRRMFFSGNSKPAFAGSGAGTAPNTERSTTPYSAVPNTGGSMAPTATPAVDDIPAAGDASDAPTGGGDEIGLTADDFDAFEQLLAEVQAAFTREDYAKLRELCTPEIVSYLSEELSQNAINGQRNDVTDVKLLQGDLSEAWREEGKEYATVAMRFESVDVMRERTTGDIVEGEATPTETTEVWTFVRPTGGAWQLSAINDA